MVLLNTELLTLRVECISACQGSTSGISDDSIINLGDLSGSGAIALGGSTAVVTFSGRVCSNPIKSFSSNFKTPIQHLFLMRLSSYK